MNFQDSEINQRCLRQLILNCNLNLIRRFVKHHIGLKLKIKATIKYKLLKNQYYIQLSILRKKYIKLSPLNLNAWNWIIISAS